MTFLSKLAGSTAILMVAAAPVLAQSAAPEAPTGTEAPAAPEMTQPAETAYTDAELETFVEAALAVTQVQQDYAQQMQTTEDESAKQELVATAQQQMKEAVEGVEGMDLATYNEIGRAAQEDEDLNRRITALVQEKMPRQPQNSDG
ncbi:DUF4168 domain-containing protein [Pseudooceanicola sp. LIPI14-2-Ac024]|uniref:DUF4168 domain-containing protein n=1 Tax=Pseudooceanicola sp. LIPI14-2-Ac024 TaxID=3344875 RepID=UPI0035D113E7